MDTIKRLLCRTAAALFALAFALLCAPWFFGIYDASALFLPVCAVGFLLTARPGFVRRFQQKHRVVNGILKIALVATVAVCFALSGLMLHAAHRPTADSGTVVVLGCQVRNGEPSLMLRRRLETALAYLEAHPDSAVVVTGGKGRNEDRAEGTVMRDYLIAHGVEPSRIYTETESANTEQNLRFSAALMQKNGLDPQIVVATDYFHQFRAKLFAERSGLTASPLGCATPGLLGFAYWCRELLAVLRALIFGF